MVKDFKSFINESLALKKDGGAHYLERIKTRLNELEVIGFTNSKGDKVIASPDEIKQTQLFYQEVLSNLADPTKSKIFSDTDIQDGYIGLIRLGKAKVTLSSGEKVEPIFKVYERVDDSTGKEVFRTGKCFWLFTIGKRVSTIKLYDADGNTPKEKDFLISKSIDHMIADRSAELAKISRVYRVNLNSREEVSARHTIILTPSNISTLPLDFKSEDDLQTQVTNIFDESLIKKKEEVQFIPVKGGDPIFSLESVPKQMNVTPDKVWLLEKNDTFKTWGAMPIIQSKQISGITGNEIQIKLGKKWLHWLSELNPPKEPVFNTPAQIDRVLKKGDTITLAKETGNGNWVANTGVITDIATDARSSEFPYIKTNGWDSSVIINQTDARKIFVDYREANESYSQVLSFAQWQAMNS